MDYRLNLSDSLLGQDRKQVSIARIPVRKCVVRASLSYMCRALMALSLCACHFSEDNPLKRTMLNQKDIGWSRVASKKRGGQCSCHSICQWIKHSAFPTLRLHDEHNNCRPNPGFDLSSCVCSDVVAVVHVQTTVAMLHSMRRQRCGMATRCLPDSQASNITAGNLV